MLKYADKTKILDWVTQQRSNSAEVDIPIKDLKDATNIIHNFENPILLSEKSSLENLNEELQREYISPSEIEEQRQTDRSIRDRKNKTA